MNLIARLGLDGRGFQAGLDKAGAMAKGFNSRLGREMGQQFKSIAIGLIGVTFLRQAINESIRWAKDTKAIKEEYLQMGIILEDDVIDKMVSAGREFSRLGLEMKKAWLPMLAGIATTVQAIVQELRIAYAYWSARGPSAVSAMMYAAQGDFVSAFAQARVGKVLGEAAVRDEDKRIVDEMTKAIIDTQTALGMAAELNKDKDAKAKTLKVDRIDADKLARIGGSVGPLQDRALAIEQQQLTQLKSIEKNTKAKAESGVIL